MSRNYRNQNKYMVLSIVSLSFSILFTVAGVFIYKGEWKDNPAPIAYFVFSAIFVTASMFFSLYVCKTKLKDNIQIRINKDKKENEEKEINEDKTLDQEYSSYQNIPYNPEYLTPPV